MKDSKEKEHRISNLKEMINSMSENKENPNFEELEEDMELINYLNENQNYKDLEIDDNFIYHPKDDNIYAVNLEETPINNDYIINTPKEKEVNAEEQLEGDIFEDMTIDMSESFDNIVHAKVGRTPILAIVSTLLGLILIVISAIIYSSGSDRIIDNVASGETNITTVIFLIFGLLFLIYGIYKIIGFRNPLENLSNSINSIESNEKKETTIKKEEPTEKIIPKSNIPLDKESYKVGEFKIKDLKNKFKKSTKNKKPAPPTQEELDKIPPAREKPAERKGLTAEEIEELEYKQVILENESIDDIFAEVEDIDEIPIISIDGEDKLKK